MNVTKKKLLTLIKDLPDTVDIEEVMYSPFVISSESDRKTLMFLNNLHALRAEFRRLEKEAEKILEGLAQ